MCSDKLLLNLDFNLCPFSIGKMQQKIIFPYKYSLYYVAIIIILLLCHSGNKNIHNNHVFYSYCILMFIVIICFLFILLEFCFSLRLEEKTKQFHSSGINRTENIDKVEVNKSFELLTSVPSYVTVTTTSSLLPNDNNNNDVTTLEAAESGFNNNNSELIATTTMVTINLDDDDDDRTIQYNKTMVVANEIANLPKFNPK